MRFLKDAGFVVKRTNFGDADRYLTIFTKHHGKIEVVAKGVRKITSRRAPHIELLNKITFQAAKGPRNLVLTEVETLATFEFAKNSLERIGALFLVCELVDKLCPIGQPHEDVFELIDSTLGQIEHHESRKTMFDFQLQMISLLGFWDKRRAFPDEVSLKNFIENLLEAKIKTRTVFKD